VNFTELHSVVTHSYTAERTLASMHVFDVLAAIEV
jgi:hypothetical protein